jgi:hypothetical protein
MTPRPSSMSHSASKASGSAASCDNTNAPSISRGSWRYPSWQSRHIEESAGGRGAMSAPITGLPFRPAASPASGEDIIGRSFLILGGREALGL